MNSNTTDSTHSNHSPYPPPIRRKKLQQVVQTRGTTVKPNSVKCPNCAATVTIRQPSLSKLLTCEYCGSELDISNHSQIRLLHKSQKPLSPKIEIKCPIKLGMQANIKGFTFTVLGRVGYFMREEGETYRWIDWQLFHPKRGFYFLTFENGHWVLNEKKPPRKEFINPQTSNRKQSFRVWDKKFIVFEKSYAEIEYVEGELSWVARKGDKVQTMEAIAPPYVLGAEWSGSEMEWYLGQYFPPSTIAKWFDLPLEQFAKPDGIYPCQPFIRTDKQRAKIKVSLYAALICLVGTVYTMLMGGGKLILDEFVFAKEYWSDEGKQSKSFVLPEGEHIMRMTSYAEVSNSWIAYTIGFTDLSDYLLFSQESALEYYYGSSGGESWSEGSRSKDTYFLLQGTDPLKMNVFGSRGEWSTANSKETQNKGEDLNIRLYIGALPKHYFIIALIICMLYPLKEWGRAGLMETGRWGDEDDD